jgi:hypothetical protein
VGAGAWRLVDPAPGPRLVAKAVRPGRVAARRRLRRSRPHAGHHDRLAAGHLHLDFAGSWEWTFGERRPPGELVDFTPSADLALERFWGAVDRWRDSVAAVTPEQLDTVGFCQYPNSSAPEEPFITVIWASNLELIHHMAEIALLRDLWHAAPLAEVSRADSA